MRLELLQPLVNVALRLSQAPAPAPAGELYTGSYHQACRRAAAVLTAPDRILILSALHGLLPLDRVIALYELRMGQPGSINPAGLVRQAEQLSLVNEQHVIVLACTPPRPGRYGRTPPLPWPAPADSAINWPGWLGSSDPVAWLKTLARVGADNCRRRSLCALTEPVDVAETCHAHHVGRPASSDREYPWKL